MQVYEELVARGLIAQVTNEEEVINLATSNGAIVKLYAIYENYSYEFVVNLLRLWRPYANYIVFTASPEYRFKYIKDYLTKNNIPFDTINSEILERHYTRKVYYNVFLDDRAGLGEISEILMELYKEIESGELKKE